MKTSRLFEIVYILLENPSTTASSLAKRFEVSTRTIYRDVETLSGAGIPIYMTKGKGGGISLLPDFVLNKALLTKEDKSEILSSMLALQELSPSKDGTSFRKVSTMLGQKQLDWVEVDLSSWGYFEEEANYFQMMKQAIFEQSKLQFLYSSGKAEQSKRRVCPIKLVFKGAAWYLYGYCELREDYRFFKIRRIRELVITDNHFQMNIPQKVIREPFDFRKDYILATIQIDYSRAFRVYDEVKDYTIRDNGDFVCKIYFPDLESICNYAFSYGGYARIIAPEQAVNCMKEQIEKLFSSYSL